MLSLETSICTIEIPDDVTCSAYEMACLEVIADGALPVRDRYKTFRATRDKQHKTLDLAKYEPPVDGRPGMYLYFVTIDKTGIRDSGMLVFEARGRQLVRTDHGEILGWRLPRREAP